MTPPTSLRFLRGMIHAGRFRFEQYNLIPYRYCVGGVMTPPYGNEIPYLTTSNTKPGRPGLAGPVVCYRVRN